MTYLGNRKASEKHVEAKTAVWWDLETCPVPDGYDARRAVESIEFALKDLGYTGPLTITAIGDMEKKPNVLRKLCSTGIKVVHAIPDATSAVIMNALWKWQDLNPPPATMMFISDKVETDMTWPLCRRQQRMSGYNLLLAYTCTTSSILYTTAQWLWKDLLLVAETRKRHVLRKCSESESELGECKSDLFCTSCDFTGKSFENFTAHFSTQEHTLKENTVIAYRSRPDPEAETETVTVEESKARKTSKRLRKTDFRLLDNHLAKSKRLRKAILTDCRLLDDHLGRLHNHLRLLRRRGRRSA